VSHIPEHGILHSHRSENLKSYTKQIHCTRRMCRRNGSGLKVVEFLYHNPGKNHIINRHVLSEIFIRAICVYEFRSNIYYIIARLFYLMTLYTMHILHSFKFLDNYKWLMSWKSSSVLF
jgi:hypothetical protein